MDSMSNTERVPSSGVERNAGLSVGESDERQSWSQLLPWLAGGLTAATVWAAVPHARPILLASTVAVAAMAALVMLPAIGLALVLRLIAPVRGRRPPPLGVFSAPERPRPLGRHGLARRSQRTVV